MIQALVNIYDLKPTETLWDRIEDRRTPDSPDGWTKEELKADIRKNGIRFMLHIDSDGNIMNGNARYWCLRQLIQECFAEGDLGGVERFKYVPVEIREMTGTFVLNFEEKPSIPLAKGVLSQVLMTKYLVIPQATKFQDYAVDSTNDRDLDRYKYVMGRHWELYNIETKDGGFAVLYKTKTKQVQ